MTVASISTWPHVIIETVIHSGLDWKKNESIIVLMHLMYSSQSISKKKKY